MDEQKPPSASDLYRDRYQGKLKSTESPHCPMCGAPELEELELEGTYGEPLIIAGCRKCNYRSDEKPITNAKIMPDERVGELLPEDWKDFWHHPELWCVETWRCGLLLRVFATKIEEHLKAESEITHMLNLYKRAIVERDQFAKLMGTMKGEHDALEKENKELRASVGEWVCPKCNIVYTESALVGEIGRCPKCDGYVGTRYQVERNEAIENLVKLNAYVDEAKKEAGDFYITGRPLPEVVEDIMEALYKAEDDLEDERSRVALRDMWLNEAEEEIRELRGKEGNNGQVK